MRRWARILWRAVNGWRADNVFKHAAAVSFYTLFSLAPMAVIAVAVAAVFYGGEAAQGKLAEQLTDMIGREGAMVVERAVAQSQLDRGGWWSTMIGISVLVVGATTVFAQLQESLNQIWGVMAKPDRNGFIVLLVRRLLSLAMVLTIGFLLLVSLVLSTAVSAFVRFAHGWVQLPAVLLQWFDVLFALAVVTVLFAMIFKVLPDVQLRWRDVWKAALLTSVLFALGRFGISVYLGRSTVASTYGAAGSLVAVLLWVYYSCLILFYGVEVTRAYLEDRGVEVRPMSKAVRVRQQVVEDA